MEDVELTGLFQYLGHHAGDATRIGHVDPQSDRLGAEFRADGLQRSLGAIDENDPRAPDSTT